MLNEFTIRAAQIEDAPGIAFVKYDGWQKTYRGIVDDAFLNAMSLEKETARWKQIIPQPLGFHLVLVNKNSEIIGFISGGKSRPNELNCEAEVYAFYLLQQYHGQGLGKKVFRHVLHLFQEAGYRSFCVYVLTKNPALRFYQSFKPDKRVDVKEKIGDREYDDTGLGWSSIKNFFAE